MRIRIGILNWPHEKIQIRRLIRIRPKIEKIPTYFFLMIFFPLLCALNKSVLFSSNKIFWWFWPILIATRIQIRIIDSWSGRPKLTVPIRSQITEIKTNAPPLPQYRPWQERSLDIFCLKWGTDFKYATTHRATLNNIFKNIMGNSHTNRQKSP